MKIKRSLLRYVLPAAMVIVGAVVVVGVNMREEGEVIAAAQACPGTINTNSGGKDNVTLSSSQCSTYRDWIGWAEGLDGNGSVQWAAATKAKYPNDNVCSLWLGPSDQPGNGEPILIDQTKISNGYYTIGMWGMCTKSNGSNTAVNIKIDNSDGSVEIETTSFARAGWSNWWDLSGKAHGYAKVNIEKFKQGATQTKVSQGTKYSKIVSIHRCHTDNGVSSNGNCSQQNVTIELIIAEAEFLGQSKVSNGLGDSAETDIVTASNRQSRSTGTVRLERYGTLPSLTFSHNVFATAISKNASWYVTRSGNGWSLAGGSGTYSGTATFSEGSRQGGYFIGNPRSGGYIRTSSNTISFNYTGTYNFCESLYVDNKQVTQVCQTVVVTNTPTIVTTGCNDWMPSSYSYSGRYVGTTSVVTKVYNSSLRGYFSGWRGLVNEGTSPMRSPAGISTDPDVSDWDDERVTYAMPTDQIQWKSCYFPGAQATYATWLVYKHGEHGTEYDTYNEVDYASASRFGSWDNYYNVTQRGGLITTQGNLYGSYSKGVTNAVGPIASRYTTTRSDVGKIYQQTIQSSSGPVYENIDPSNHCWSGPDPCGCPYCCAWESCCCGRYCESDCTCCAEYCCRPCTYCHYYYNGWENRRVYGPVTSNAAVKIPYNFRTYASISLSGSDKVYAGDTITVTNAYVEVQTRYNGVTERTYATRVDNASVKLTAYIANSTDGQERTVSSRNGGYDNICNFLSAKQCRVVKEEGGTLNSGGTLALNQRSAWSSSYGLNDTYNVFDASAGDYMCFVVSVYPASSGTDKMMQSSGDDKWFISAPACKMIAKKPSFQVWGGNVYSNGDMSSTVSQKHNLYQITNYSPQGSGLSHFGSWVEEAILSNGKVEQIASGAAMGRNNSSSVYGTNSYDFCTNQIALTIANYSTTSTICGNNKVAGGNANLHILSQLRSALVDYLLPTNREDIGTSSVYLSSDTGKEIKSGTGRNIRYIYRNGALAISGGYITTDGAQIVQATGGISINGDISYNDTAMMSSMWQAPKAIIYANGDIRISCNVSRVDAILIATGTVYTCDSYSGDDGTSNPGYRSTQLKINGMVIANKLEMGRTFGNAVGDKSGEPAEIINYDTSGLIWEYSMADSGESGAMTTVYQRELAPRY